MIASQQLISLFSTLLKSRCSMHGAGLHEEGEGRVIWQTSPTRMAHCWCNWLILKSSTVRAKMTQSLLVCAMARVGFRKRRDLIRLFKRTKCLTMYRYCYYNPFLRPPLLSPPLHYQLRFDIWWRSGNETHRKQSTIKTDCSTSKSVHIVISGCTESIFKDGCGN